MTPLDNIQLEPFNEFCNARGIKLTIARMWRLRYGLPVIQIGRRLYMTEQDYQNWLNQHKTAKTQIKEPSKKAFKPAHRTGISNKMQRIY